MKNNLIPFYNQKNLFIERAEDVYLIDEQGKKYIDFESGDWAANLGHNNKSVVEVIKNQAEKVIHDGLLFRNRLSETLSHNLLSKLELENGKSTFLNSGSEAVNLGITIARNLTKRSKVLKLDCSYLSAFGFGRNSADNTDLVNIPMDNYESLDQIDFSKIAVFVLEAGNSYGLIKFPSYPFIAKMVEKIKNNNGLLMANEVTVGFGRTGKWFGFQHYDYKPDIVSVGKALGNGYPISGVCISGETAKDFDLNYFRYAQSHQNDPLGCAVGIEVIHQIDELDLVQKSKEKGEYFKSGLIGLQKAFPNQIKEIRGRGLMVGMELSSAAECEKLADRLMDEKMIVGYKQNVIRFMPPLTIPTKVIDQLIDLLGMMMKN